MNKPKGYVQEIFASVQGEGSWVGERQIFLRLAGCQDHCAYCDTPESRQPHPSRARIQSPLAEGKPVWLANPLSPEEVAACVERCQNEAGPFHSLALTGGEPLQQAEFIKALVHTLNAKHLRMPIFLETNGHRVEDLGKVLRVLDFVAADIKLRSATGVATPWAQHVQFLKKSRQLPGCVKVVVVPGTTALEIVHAARLAWECVPKWDFILQPATGVKWKTTAAQQRLENFMQTASRLHPHVRLIPQMHPILGIA
jgi:organic radical activating enzyme